MAENAYQVPTNGAEVRIQDLDSISDNAGYADDRVLWELFRLTTGSATPDRAIIPYGKRDGVAESGFTSTALVHGNVSDGSVRVMPFRAIVGSTNTSSQLGKLRDIRSGYKVGASTQQTVVPLTANNLGGIRWDLVYAIVTPDQDGDSASILVKDPTSLVVDPVPSTIISKKTGVTLDVVIGTIIDTRPAIPADAGGSYNIPLAYIAVPNLFTTSSAVERHTIHEVAPCYPIHSSTGAASLVPANQQHEIGGTVDDNQNGDTSEKRPGAYVPSTMVGEAGVFILLQRGLTPFSHVDDSVVDDSRDWRFRYFEWSIHAKTGSSNDQALPSDRNVTNPSNPASNSKTSLSFYGCGQSFVNDSALMPIVAADCQGVAMFADSTNAPGLMTSSNSIAIYVRDSDGALVFKQSGSDTFQAIVRLRGTAPYSNYDEV